MSTEVMSTALRPRVARRPPRTQLRLEHVVMGGAIVCLIVLVVLPLAFAAVRQLQERRRLEPRCTIPRC